MSDEFDQWWAKQTTYTADIKLGARTAWQAATERMQAEGWRQCAIGQKSTQYCAMAELAEASLKELKDRKDNAYLERNQCVSLIATMANALGYRAGTARTAIEGWSESWHGCVYIDIPAGQVSWHYHDSHAHLFAHLPPYCDEWDGHDTPEKYRRVLQRPVENVRAEAAESECKRLREAIARWIVALKWADGLTTVVDEMRDALEEE